MAQNGGQLVRAGTGKRVLLDPAGVTLPHSHSALNLLDASALSQLGDDILTEENKRRQLAKEAALKQLQSTLSTALPTVVVIEAAEEGGVDPFIAYGIEAGSDDEDGNYDDADDVDGVQAGNDDELRAVEVRAAEVCAAKVRAVEVSGRRSFGRRSFRAAELRAAEIRAAEIRAAEIRAAEVRAVEDRAAAVRAADVRSAEARQNGAGAAHLAA
ncbi:unnamed protein product [Closterium sp. NIES-65]|nr:unnamed protein product [Closterium sp. NIES-65]